MDQFTTIRVLKNRLILKNWIQELVWLPTIKMNADNPNGSILAFITYLVEEVYHANID
jgi:hypothetical protein